ncbi:MAG: hypothetical protein RJA99_4279 [Pseudomonadota bacterium]|jgi:DNA-binding MarR family transcriptional regulator
MGLHSEAVLAVMAEDTWHSTAAIAEASGLAVRAVAQTLRHLVGDGHVEKTADGTGLFRRLVAGALTVVDHATHAAEPPLPASYAVWDDGAMTITRAQGTVYLSPDEVSRLRAHLARFNW